MGAASHIQAGELRSLARFASTYGDEREARAGQGVELPAPVGRGALPAACGTASFTSFLKIAASFAGPPG